MVNINELKASIIRKGYNHADVAKMIGITPKTFSSRLKKRVFGSDEIEIMIKVLDIKDPVPIFFDSLVTLKDTKLKTRKED